MDSFYWYRKTKVYFGTGEFQNAAKRARGFGDRALLVTGRSAMKRLGLTDKLLLMLDKEDIQAVVYDKIEPNPRVDSVDQGAMMAEKEGCDFIIALGGGSVMDASKGIALVSVSKGSVWNYIRSWDKEPDRISNALPVITIPTIAATGSELNGTAVITKWDTHEKAVLEHEILTPVCSVIDPELTVSTNSKTTADSGTDILCHLLETYITGNNTSDVSDRMTEGLLQIVIEYTIKAIAYPDDIEARSYLSWASSLALSGIPSAGRGGSFPIHQIEHVLSGWYDISHGRGLGIILVPYLEFMLDVRPERIAKLGERLFDYTGTMEEKAEAAILKIKNWLNEIGIKEHLENVGIKHEALAVLSEDVIRLYGYKHGSLSGSSRLNKDAVVTILIKSMHV
ncbi:MAG: iron-containing alcohol dehydrogenase [Deltaproteobacteria bacterium]|nr:iron-containing alcohol dehydrogenase [Deltaproteobacteria bacterium]MCL5792418.1 iron-containing alcohol dehydrogenase [Deltaproteobacteria bacterium]